MRDKLKELIPQHWLGKERKEKLINSLLILFSVSERNYTKAEMIAAAKYGYEYHESTSYPEKNFEDNCKNNTEQWMIGVIDAH